MGQDSISLTDHGNLIMAPNHLQACNKVGIKPIVGIEAYFRPDRTDRTVNHRQAYHLLILAQNETGWKNLIKLSTEAHQSGFYGYPCTDYEILEEYSKGLVCSSACIGGYLPQLILNGASDIEIANAIENHLNIFGKNYFLEIMPHDIPAQQIVNSRLSNLSLEYNIPLVATGDSHYPYEDWKDTREVVFMIGINSSIKKREKQREEGKEVYDMNIPLHMFSEDEMYEMFAKYHPYLPPQTVKEAINQSQKIADSVEEFELDKSIKMPRVTDSIEEAEQILEKWCEEGLKRISKEDDPVYLERLKHELQTIKNLDIVQYFILVGKIVRWAREQKIRISSGRGSASGSLVCYLIRITTIDPIAYDLLFERFLNPNRKGLPDIDIDFEDRRRDEVLDYIKEEFGEKHVASILTLGTFGAKAALKDAARVLDVPYGEINTVTKAIPDAKDVSGAANIPPLKRCREMFTVIDEFASKYPDVWKHALRLEGHVKQLGKHAAGIVVTDQPIVEHVPLMRGANDIVTAWSDTARYAVITDIGLLKIDILSLEGLSRQGETVELIKKHYGVDVDLDNLPVARDPKAVDPQVMEIFKNAQTLGVFQFGGSKGIINFLKHVKPDTMEDLIACNALYRPGGLEGGDAFKYGDLKKGKAPVVYWHPSVKPYVQKTYGIMAYQEQMQQIVQALGKFTPAESDDMRKATSKLYRLGKEEAKEFMAQYKEQWMKGCDENGLKEEEAESIWERMLAFGGYSFNRSHSASYSLCAYQDAYLKRHWPLAFYTPLLTREEDRSPIIRESRAIGNADILGPDINTSEIEFTMTDISLRYGLASVKYVGDVAVKEIMDNRPYESKKDFRNKTNKQKCNARCLEYLEWAGAFDSLGERQDLDIEEKRNQEIEAIGIAITGTGESQKFDKIIGPRIVSEQKMETLDEGDSVIIAGEITEMKHHTIKSGYNKGKKMGFANLYYDQNSWDCTIFREKYEKYKNILKEGNVIMVRGRKGSREEVILDQAIEVSRLKEELEKAK